MLKLVSYDEYVTFCTDTYCVTQEYFTTCDKYDICKNLLEAENYVLGLVKKCYDVEIVKNAICIMTHDQINMNTTNDNDGRVAKLNAYKYLVNNCQIIADEGSNCGC